MTLAYGGETADMAQSDFNKMAKDAISAGRVTGSFSLQVMGVEEFGVDADAVDALTFHTTPQLLVARRMVEPWDTGEFKDYRPHATIGPVGSAVQNGLVRGEPWDEPVSYRSRRDSLPLSLWFNKIVVCWNDDKLVFNLNMDY